MGCVCQREELGEGRPEPFDFLGFTYFWTRSRKWGSFVIGRKTIKKRMLSGIKGRPADQRDALAQFAGGLTGCQSPPAGSACDFGNWLNPNAPANWLADVEKWRQDLGVSYEHLSYEMEFWNVEGSVAYAVIAGTLTVTIKGQTVVRTGTLAYTFSKHGEEWKIDAQAWGRTS